jgi:hypothetical protein
MDQEAQVSVDLAANHPCLFTEVNPHLILRLVNHPQSFVLQVLLLELEVLALHIRLQTHRPVLDLPLLVLAIRRRQQQQQQHPRQNSRLSCRAVVHLLHTMLLVGNVVVKKMGMISNG